MTEVIVTVEQGKLKGKTNTDYSGNVYYSFQGIPFGKPPIGQHRFKVISVLLPLRVHLTQYLGSWTFRDLGRNQRCNRRWFGLLSTRLVSIQYNRKWGLFVFKCLYTSGTRTKYFLAAHVTITPSLRFIKGVVPWNPLCFGYMGEHSWVVPTASKCMAPITSSLRMWW